MAMIMDIMDTMVIINHIIDNSHRADIL